MERRNLDANKVYDLSHRLWYQVTMALTETPGRGAPTSERSGEVGALDGAIMSLLEVLVLLEKRRGELLDGPSSSA